MDSEYLFIILLLERFHSQTGGESLRANVRLVLRNVVFAAEIAVVL